MRIAILAMLVGLAMLAAHSGHLGIALAIAALKTVLVGLAYMELSHAHPAHRWGFSLFAVALTAGVGLVAAS